MTLLLLFTSLVFFIIIRMPVAMSMLMSSFLYLLVDGRFSYTIMAERVASAMDSFPFLAIPFFILAAEIMNTGGISDRIFNFAQAFVGHIQGGLGQVNVVASIIFSGMSGSSAADAAGLGAIEIKAMLKEGYDPGFSAAITAASSTIGPIFPPSIQMVLYGVMAQVSAGHLFAAGMAPGLLLGLGFMVTVALMARTGMIKAPRRPRANLKEILATTREAAACLLIPVVLLGGIFSGSFTPTEAGAVAVFLALTLALIYRDMSFRDIPALLVNGALASGKVAFLIAAANIFGWIVTRERIGHMAYEWIVGLGLEPWAILLLINVLFFIAGLFIEGVAILMISVPVFVPVLSKLGIHPVSFGVLVVLLNMIGFLTPPVGVGTYIAMELAGARLEDVMRFMIPLFIPLVIMALLITYWPPMTLFIPKLIFKF